MSNYYFNSLLSSSCIIFTGEVRVLNTFEKHLLKLAHENFRKNGSSYTEVQPKNGDEAIYLSDAAEYLEESGHIVSHSNALANGSASILNGGLIISYELTEEGLSVAKELT